MTQHDRILAETNRNQARAADPTASAWVGANAGTGKTHVLTTRILRLLLAGTPPERILALTFTKAAAAEMSTRIFNRLAGWATSDDGKLTNALHEILGSAPKPEQITTARQLFARAIETPGGLKVQTIHGFCEGVLQRFPLEAAVPPGFQVLDDQQQKEILRTAIDDVLASTVAEKDGALQHALATAIAFAVDDSFDGVLAEALRNRNWIIKAVQLDGNANKRFSKAHTLFSDALGVATDETPAHIEAKIARQLSAEQLRHIVGTLKTGSANDIKSADRFAAVHMATAAAAKIEALSDAFLTGQGEPRKSLITKTLATKNADLEPLLTRAQTAFVDLNDKRLRVVLRDATIALLVLADAVEDRYAAAKARRAALDFDDLIEKTASLLGGTAAGQTEWVLYKLDNGIDHILVDEAQDTSPRQWELIEALAREFFAGSGARDITRTIFAVGDEKQSIYGFQGAAPKMFAEMGARFSDLAKLADLVLPRIPLTLSFRTVSPILDAVDTIFANPTVTPGVTAEASPISHAAFRTGQSGLVELWPTEKPEETASASPWLPLDDQGTAAPANRLAGRIADTIGHWLTTGEKLASENRPIRAGDILILVRRRQPFAPVMVAALKNRRIPVAGADRMTLTEQIAIKDLVALGEFLVLPEDDLTLAALLKSPLFDFTDDDLMQIAVGRRGTLWSALIQHAKDNARFAPAAETLKRLRMQADYVPPFEFFSSILDRDGGRRKLLERLGEEAADAIDAFLDLALSYDSKEPPSLQGFLSWLAASDREIKRDMEQGRDEVRVMTVHGAKGLEAPIVFLPDTCSSKSGGRPGGLLKTRLDLPPAWQRAEPFLWPVKGTSATAPVADAREALEAAEREERNRLLYVALTRARDRLYIAGFEGKRARAADSWYAIVSKGLASTLTPATDWAGLPVLRSASSQAAEPKKKEAASTAAARPSAPPEWARRMAPREAQLAVPFAPSRLAPLESDDLGDPVELATPAAVREPPTPSPSVLSADNRFLRGTVTHALLEHLPSLPPDTWDRAAADFVAARATALSKRARASIVTETLAVLRLPRFAPIFSASSRAEVPIVAVLLRPDGRGPPLRLNGQIDRLAVSGNRVLIVDYKTNRPPPTDVVHVSEAYLLQLAAYRLAIGAIFPGFVTEAAILWTDGPRLMEIPPGVLDAAATRLWSIDPASLDGGGGAS